MQEPPSAGCSGSDLATVWFRSLVSHYRTSAVVAGLDNAAMMRDAAEECSGHLGVMGDAGPLTEREVGGDDHRGLFVGLADQVEQHLSA